MIWNVINCNVFDGIPLADNSVHCVVTSPPYWGLRDYGVDGQLGLEPTFDEYLGRMVAVCREIKRVLRHDGTFWLNMGDGYAGSGRGAWNRDDIQKEVYMPGITGRKAYSDWGNLKPKDLIGQPWRLAFALQANGWWLRSDIIWSKPNPMPESVTDRPTKAHEYIFLLTKSAKYYYDQDAVREPHIHVNDPRNDGARHAYKEGSKFYGDIGKQTNTKIDCVSFHPSGRNRRTVWEIATQPFPEAHFATYPEKLVEPCVKAGTSQKGCCPECGMPWERILSAKSGGTIGQSWHPHENDAVTGNCKNQTGSGFKTYNPGQTIGWQPACDCGKDPVPCTVLDPFSGSGTTGVVAIREGCNYVGLELKPEYISISRKRLTCAAVGLKPVEYDAGQKVLFRK